VLSAVIVLHTANEEPFTVFRWSDLAVIALGGLVFALFVGFAVAGVRRYLSTPPPTALARLAVGASLIWTAINLFYLGVSICGYFQDLTNPQFGPWR